MCLGVRLYSAKQKGHSLTLSVGSPLLKNEHFFSTNAVFLKTDLSFLCHQAKITKEPSNLLRGLTVYWRNELDTFSPDK